jgi:GAF domain-containing protein
VREAPLETTPAQADSGVSEEVLGISSLARAMAGEAGLADVGALCWMMLKQVLPCAAIGLFVPREEDDTVVGKYAAGQHSLLIRNLRTAPGEGVVGWVAAHRRRALNAEPALDFGLRAIEIDPPLLSSLAVPLIHDSSVVAILAIYATARNAFTDDHARLLDLLAPKLASSLAAVRERDALEAEATVQPGARPQADFKLLKLRARQTAV